MNYTNMSLKERQAIIDALVPTLTDPKVSTDDKLANLVTILQAALVI